MRQPGLFLIAMLVGNLPILCAGQQVESQPSSTQVQHFVALSFDNVPDSVIKRDFCDEGDKECLHDIRSEGRAWAADIDGDGIRELIIWGGSRTSGSAGMRFSLYRAQADWKQIARATENDDRSDASCEVSYDPGWFTDRPRLDILPRSHKGYKDLRVAVDLCLKWDGQAYIPYEPADYKALSPLWFDDKDPREAEIFWKIRYAHSAGTVRFEPQWFSITPCFLPDKNKKRNDQQARACAWEERSPGCTALAIYPSRT